MKTFILSAILLLSLAAAAFAQSEYETGKNEFTVWGGFSPDSSTLIKGTGRVEDARFGVVAFRYARRFNNSDKVNLKYTADVIPIAFLNYPDIEISGSPTSLPFVVRSVRPTRYGFGASPLGIQANFRPRKKIQPFIEATGGLLYLNRRTPNLVGTRFQFTADVGGGVEFKLKEKRAFTVGYKYFHISNGNRGIQNPGFDNNLIYVGYTFFSK
ncbi:MAG: acyloxyacyl hydrolase [Pyrinomonadaceae bacterium]